MKPIKPEDRRVANIYRDEFKTFYSGDQPDGDVLQVNRDKPLGVGFHAYRMAPGTTTIAHKHNGAEEFLIIEGDLTDNDGTDYGPGDLVWLADGTEHFSTTRDGCLLAVYIAESEDTLKA